MRSSKDHARVFVLIGGKNGIRVMIMRLFSTGNGKLTDGFQAYFRVFIAQSSRRRRLTAVLSQHHTSDYLIIKKNAIIKLPNTVL